MAQHDRYISPFSTRYASDEMKFLFSSQKKFSTWRRLWIALAEAERELGLEISQQQIDEMKAHVEDIDFEKAAEYEAKFRHDVMAHVHTYGECCPTARPIIHLGATSCYVGDNTDVIIMREGLQLVPAKTQWQVLRRLSRFAEEYKDMPTLAYTHLPARPADHRGQARHSVDQRAATWTSKDDPPGLENLELRGSKGTTGTQASFWSCSTAITPKCKASGGIHRAGDGL